MAFQNKFCSGCFNYYTIILIQCYNDALLEGMNMMINVLSSDQCARKIGVMAAET